MNFLGTNITELAARKKLNMSVLSEQLEINYQTLRSYTTGTKPSIEVMIQIADFFEVFLDTLIRVDLRITNTDDLMSPEQYKAQLEKMREDLVDLREINENYDILIKMLKEKKK